MPAPTLSLAHLRTFLAVARLGSSTRAAVELNLSQPAISRQLQALAHDIGVPLFERNGFGMRPTEAGHALVAEAEKILRRVEEGILAVTVGRQVEAERIRVGVSRGLESGLVDQALAALIDLCPGIRLHGTIHNSAEIGSMVQAGHLDLGLVRSRPRATRLRSELLARDRLVFIAAPSHSLAERREVSVADLGGQTWVLREPAAASRRLIEHRLGAEGVEVGRTIELSSVGLIKSFVARGLGLSVLSETVVVDELQRGDLREVRVNGLSLELPIYLIRREGERPSAAQDAFASIARQLLPPGGSRLSEA